MSTSVQGPDTAQKPLSQLRINLPSLPEALASLFADWTAQDAEAAAGLESITPSEGALFWQVPKGRSADTPFAKRAAKAKYKPVITTRNLRTMHKILAVTKAG